MKKISLIFFATVAAMAATCCVAQTPGYTITGTVENALDGDSVTLCEAIRGELSPLERTVVKGGKFTFKGRQDEAVPRYITAKIAGRDQILDFFLENGNIAVSLGANKVSATGTPNNDVQERIRQDVDRAIADINQSYAYLRDTTLTAEQRAAGEQRVRDCEAAYYATLKRCTKENISNIAGVSLFKQFYRDNTLEENDSLLRQVPAQFQNDRTIQTIRGRVENGLKTKVGQKFTDFEMTDIEGAPARLSDFAGKGKLVLVDFWASWCGPCVHEMPTIVEAYAKYKDRGLEIVGVSLDEDADSWKQAVKRLKMTWPQLSDLKGWRSTAAQRYAVNSIPHTVLIDAEGNIIDRNLRGPQLLARLAASLP